jgi:hypothetical protein
MLWGRNEVAMRLACFAVLVSLLPWVAGCGEPEDLTGPSTPVDAATDSPSADVVGDAEVDGGLDADPGTDAPDVVDPACAPPTEAATAAVCLRFDPEQLDLISGDEAYDGEGVLVVQVYDTPVPEPEGGPEVSPLAEVVVPDQTGGEATMGVYDPWEPVRFDALPATVYVRALFVDNVAAFSGNDLTAGVWVGGYEFPKGLLTGGLQAVALTVGEGTEVVVPMNALRSMRVTLTKSMFVQPKGNGEGPAGFLLVDTPQVTVNSAVWGIGQTPCATIHSASGIALEGVFVGDGDFYGLGYLDDYGTGMETGITAGTMVNLTLVGGQPALPDAARIAVPPGAYRVEAKLELTGTVPFQGVPPQDTVSCP